MKEAVELITAEIERTKHNRPENVAARVYAPDLGPNVLVFETVYESAEQHDRFWAEYDRTTPEAAAFWEKWYEVTERNAGTDRWSLFEWR
jgi:hypothetical protein